MNESTQSPLIFHTRRGAIIAFCIGILLTLRNVRYLFELYVPGHTTWFTRYRFPPTLFDIILHLWCAIFFAALLIFILRRTRSAERAYLAIFVGVVIFAPLSDIPSLASTHLYAWIAAFTELALIPSAVWMYRSLPPHRAHLEAKQAGRR
jgi:hypothetical protein